MVKRFKIIGKECSMSFCLFRLFNSISSLITNLAQVCVLFVLFDEKDDKIDKTHLGKANTFLPLIFIHSPIDFQLISPGFAIFLSQSSALRITFSVHDAIIPYSMHPYCVMRN
jgi:hypothetical protein